VHSQLGRCRNSVLMYVILEYVDATFAMRLLNIIKRLSNACFFLLKMTRLIRESVKNKIYCFFVCDVFSLLKYAAIFMS